MEQLAFETAEEIFGHGVVVRVAPAGHQLQRTRNMEYIIENTKTKNGERFVPMSNEVMACFRRIIANRKKPAKEPMIDGYTGFLFLDKNKCQWLRSTGSTTSSIS